MRSLPLRLVVLTTASALIGTAVLVACSSDDTVVTEPPPDGSLPDGTSNQGDTGVKVDAGAVDAGDDGASFDAGLNTDDFPGQVARAICRSLARCCYGNADLDGGARVDAGDGGDAGYNQGVCLNNYSLGFAGSNPPTQVDSGPELVTVNQAAAADCLAKIGAMSCGDVPTAEFRAIRSACYGAMSGKAQAGQPCADTIHCASGHFCNKADGGDAGPGTCEAVRALNAPCGNGVDPKLSPPYAAEYGEEMCSYRGGGDTNRYCEFFNFVTTDFNAQPTWKCVETRVDTAECANTAWCGSGQCYAPDDDSIAHCVPSTPFFSAPICNFYKQ